MKNDSSLNIKLPKPTKKKIHLLAGHFQRSNAWIVRKAVNNFIRQNDAALRKLAPAV